MRVVLERWAPWLAAAVLVAGIASFVATRHGGSPSSPPLPHTAAPLTPAARRVAYAFLDTAVARKHLDRGWDVVAPELKQGMSLDEWKTGTIPVVPYPVADASVVLHVVSSFTDTARLHVSFVPKPGAKVAAASFTLGLHNVGGHWLASSWQPSSTIGPQSGK